MSSATTSRWFRWLGTAAEVGIFAASVTYLVTVQLWALLAWLIVGIAYLLIGGAAVWNGRALDRAEAAQLRPIRRWSWIAPVLAALLGAMSAVTALLSRESTTSDPSQLVLPIAASLGVILSWLLLQVGFTQIYIVTDLTGSEESLRFPEGGTPSILSYLYFAFTVGTSFATSDVEVVSIRMRRLVLIHSVVAFFYNALVVAVAFQVLQSIVPR